MGPNDEPYVSDATINANDDTDMNTNGITILTCQRMTCRKQFQVTHRIIAATCNLYNNTQHMVQMCQMCLNNYSLKRGGRA